MSPNDATPPNHQLIILLTNVLQKHKDALLNIIAVKENLHYDTLHGIVSNQVIYSTYDINNPKKGEEAL